MSGSAPLVLPGYATATGGLDRIRDGIQAVLPGVQLNLLNLELWSALEQFCIRSTFWQQRVTWTLQPYTSAVNLGALLAAGLPADVLQVLGSRRYSLTPPATILVADGNGVQQRMGSALLSVKPAQLDESLVPAAIFNDWSDALRDGTLARLYMQPSKPYSSPQLAQIHGRLFQAAVCRARAGTSRYGLRAGRFFPYFADGRQCDFFGNWYGGDTGAQAAQAVYDQSEYDREVQS